MNCITYKDGYKYQLSHDYSVWTGIVPAKPVKTTYIDLDMAGVISISKGYAWDGPSGPAIDTKNFMRGSLVHDAFYQLMREGHVDHSQRDDVDHLLKTICLEDGMSHLRAWWVYRGVKWFADPAALPSARKPDQYAP